MPVSEGGIRSVIARIWRIIWWTLRILSALLCLLWSVLGFGGALSDDPSHAMKRGDVKVGLGFLVVAGLLIYTMLPQRRTRRKLRGFWHVVCAIPTFLFTVAAVQTIDDVWVRARYHDTVPIVFGSISIILSLFVVPYMYSLIWGMTVKRTDYGIKVRIYHMLREKIVREDVSFVTLGPHANGLGLELLCPVLMMKDGRGPQPLMGAAVATPFGLFMPRLKRKAALVAEWLDVPFDETIHRDLQFDPADIAPLHPGGPHSFLRPKRTAPPDVNEESLP